MVWEWGICLLLLCFHQADPFAVAEHSHNGVEAVEGGREWYAFVYVEHGAYQIHRQPAAIALPICWPKPSKR